MATLVKALPLPLGFPYNHTANRGTTALVVPMTHPLAERLATEEARFFEEAPVLFDLPQADELFAFLVIAVDGAARHIVRLSAPALHPGSGLLPFFLTDLVDADPDLTLSDVKAYYAELNIEVDRLISVETQFRLGEQMEPIRSADLAYLTLFQIVKHHSCQGVVAHLNAPAIKSFKRVGLDWHPFAGRVDLRTPTVKEDGTIGFDANYQPVCLPLYSNVDLLDGLSAFTPELVYL